jgi:hypothetical protein
MRTLERKGRLRRAIACEQVMPMYQALLQFAAMKGDVMRLSAKAAKYFYE